MSKGTKLLAPLVVLALFGAACSDDGSQETAAPNPSETTVAPATTVAPSVTTTAGAIALPAGEVSCDEPITVGVITDLTGALAIYGAHISRGVPIGFAYATGGQVQTALEQRYTVDDCDIRVVFKDDQSNPDLAAEAANELIEDEGAAIIIGSVKADSTEMLQGIARENDVILIAAPDASTDLTGSRFDPNTFRVSRSDYQDRMAICDHFVNDLDRTTFVQIAADYGLGYDGARAYRDTCEFYGGQFLQETVFAPAGTVDFSSYMTPLAESGAEAFLVTWAGGGFPSLLAAAIAEGVIADETVLGSPFVDNIVVKGFFGDVVGTTSGISYHYTAPDNPINDYLIQQASASFDALPDQFDADGMNAAIAVVAALKVTSGAADADSLKAALEGLSFDGPKGVITIRAQDHTAIQDIFIVKLANVDDPEAKFYENVATVRPEPPCLLEGQHTARCLSLPVETLSG